MTTAVTASAPGRARTATRATALAFISSGFAFASWAARIPQVRDSLHLSSGELGLVLLAAAAGSVLGLPASGPVVHRWGTRATVTGMSVLLAVAFVGIAVGHRFGVVPLVVSLFFMGLAYGAWDVAMNVQGAQVEQHLGRAIMPRFHAGYSVGTVAGALVGAGAVALGVPVTVHLVVVGVAVGVLVPLGVRGFLDPDVPVQEEAGAAPAEGGRSALAAWREPRTLVIGLFVLAFAFTEGTANDWIGVALIDGYEAPAAVGTLGFAVFLGAMTTARWFGPHVLDRFGRVPVIRALTVVAVVGLLLFVLGPNLAVAVAGALLWGAGASLGFPVGMSAGSDDPAHAAGRVSVISSVGYCAFLGGPPLIGFLGEHFTVLHGLLAVAVLLAVAAVLAPVLRPPAAAPEAPRG